MAVPHLLRAWPILLSVAVCTQVFAKPPSTARPNVLLVLADDLDVTLFRRTDGLRPLFQQRGVEFTESFVSIALCCPSRASLLRGQYAHNTGVLHNFPPDGGFRGFYKNGREESTLATWLEVSGVRTGFFGKYLNGYPEEDAPDHVPPGWTDWFVPSRGSAYNSYSYVVNHNGRERTYGQGESDHVTDVLTGEVDSFIRKAVRRGEPFFAHLSYYAPHLPATAPARHRGRYDDESAPRSPAWNEEDISDKPGLSSLPLFGASWEAGIDQVWRSRRESMEAVAEGVAQLTATLNELGVADNTWVVFTSDNGFHYGDHRLPWGKNTPFEPDIRVPLVVVGPGVAPGGVVERTVVNHDLAPTIAEIFGVAVPEFVDGRSWVALARGGAPDLWRQGFLLEHRSVAEAKAAGRMERAAGQRARPKKRGAVTGSPDEPSDMPARAALAEYDRDWQSYYGVRTAEHKYLQFPDGSQELYDLRSDAYELQNIADTAPPELLLTLRRQADALRHCVGAGCRAAEDAAAGAGTAEVGTPETPTTPSGGSPP